MYVRRITLEDQSGGQQRADIPHSSNFRRFYERAPVAATDPVGKRIQGIIQFLCIV